MPNTWNFISDPQQWIALASLTALEIILGIDNLLFIAIVAGRLPPNDQRRAYRFGLVAAMATRVLLLLSLTSIIRMQAPLFAVFGHEFSLRHLVLLGGGLFLLAKGVHEIFHEVEGIEVDTSRTTTRHSVGAAVLQIMLLDIVFSIDSVITAIGMVENLVVMIIAIVLAMLVMLMFAARIGDFVRRHPSVKVLALAFLTMIGVVLVAEAFGQHIARGYIYFSMAFALGVELLHLRRAAKTKVPTFPL